VDFIEAGRACGIKPDIMRRWLDRPAVRALLHAERRAFRAAICAGNELSLARVRDRSENGMAVIGAVRTLENIAEEAEVRPRGQHQEAPGLVIVINNGPQQSAPPIDVTPVEPVEPER
jgi:hypothetical protein